MTEIRMTFVYWKLKNSSISIEDDNRDPNGDKMFFELLQEEKVNEAAFDSYTAKVLRTVNYCLISCSCNSTILFTNLHTYHRFCSLIFQHLNKIIKQNANYKFGFVRICEFFDQCFSP